MGAFAENKDAARDIRRKRISPSLKRGQKVILNFSGVDSTTQSFVHALISEVIRENGSDVLDKVFFQGCNEKVKQVINIVTEYMQESD